MNTEFENEQDKINVDTRARLQNLSRAMLRMHKTLLEGEKAKYEAVNGRIPNPNVYLSLVLDDPHFAWLRKISSLIALIDEATSIRRPASEQEAQALLDEAKELLNFENPDEDFNKKFQNALQENSNAVLGQNDALKIVNQS